CPRHSHRLATSRIWWYINSCNLKRGNLWVASFDCIIGTILDELDRLKSERKADKVKLESLGDS
ncbi:hypothetical protein ACFLTZ_04875, partial [Chloroflexota bacterium]